MTGPITPSGSSSKVCRNGTRSPAWIRCWWTTWAPATPPKETCAYFRLIVSDSEGYYQLAAGKAFDISKPILWLTSTLTAGYSTSNAYLAYSSISVQNQVSGFTGTQGASLYLVGTLVGSTFLQQRIT